MDYKSELKIDKYSLDEEWLQQPSKIDWINTAWADAGKKRDKAEEYLEIVEANLDLTARTGKNADEADEHPIPYTTGLDKLPEKLTESVIKSWIKVHPRRIEAQNKVIDTKHEVTVLYAGTKAFSSRGDALKDLVKLFLADRYTGASSPPEQELRTKGVEKRTDAVSDRLDERLKKSVRKPIAKV
jgi:hypothetical protein